MKTVTYIENMHIWDKQEHTPLKYTVKNMSAILQNQVF